MGEIRANNDLSKYARGYELLDSYYSNDGIEVPCTILRILVEKQPKYYCYVPNDDKMISTNELRLLNPVQLQIMKDLGFMGIQIKTDKEYMEVDYIFPKNIDRYELLEKLSKLEN